MVEFDLWIESLVFCLVYSIIIIVPCVFMVIIGKELFHNLGHYPSKTPAIQMSIFFKLVLLETVTFALLIGFFFLFVD